MRPTTVDDVFDELRKKYKADPEIKSLRLDVILESSGGSIDSAYNIGLLLRRYATEKNQIDKKRQEETVEEFLKELPPELLKQLQDTARKKEKLD